MNIKRIEAAIHIAVWMVAYLLLALLAETIGVFNKRDQTLFYPLTAGTLMNAGMFYTAALLIIPRYATLKQVKMMVLLLLLLFTGTTVLKSVVDYFFFESIVSTQKEPFEEQVLLNALFDLILLCMAMAYGFTRVWIRREAQQQVMQQEKLSTELNFLRAQVNPHFLFNTLNTAYASATLFGDERTAAIIDKLSYLIRYMLYESNEAQVLLHLEIRYIEHFIALQRQRVSDEIQVAISFRHAAGCQDYISPLLLLPFVENAFKHGIRYDKPSYIDIQLEVINDHLTFAVRNSIGTVPMGLPTYVGGVGLGNVKKRLALLYPAAHDLCIRSDEDDFDIRLAIKLNKYEMHCGR